MSLSLQGWIQILLVLEIHYLYTYQIDEIQKWYSNILSWNNFCTQVWYWQPLQRDHIMLYLQVSFHKVIAISLLIILRVT